MFPLVRELAAAGAPVRVSVAVACRVLGFSKQAYYQWLANPVSDRDWDEAHLINAARDVWDEDRCQGYRLISDELVDDGWQVSERRVWRVCSQEGMFSAAHRRKGSRKGGYQMVCVRGEVHLEGEHHGDHGYQSGARGASSPAEGAR